MPLIEVVSNEYKKLSGAPGKSLNVSVSGIGGKSYECELYSVPGIISRPHPGMIGIDAKVGDAKIIIATHNYSLETDIETGDTMVYSTDSDGAKQGTLIIRNDGKFSLSNLLQDQHTLINKLFDEIVSIKTTGSPTNHILDPSSIVAFEALRIEYNQLWEAG